MPVFYFLRFRYIKCAFGSKILRYKILFCIILSLYIISFYIFKTDFIVF